MTRRTPPAPPTARVTTLVDADAQTAFRVFTEETDLWWRRGPKYRFTRASDGVLRFEGGVGGRLLEVAPGDPADAFEVGRVRVWEPGRRLVFSWRIPNFAPQEQTEVDVRFEPVGDRTRVTIEHRGWDSLPHDHPARHGLSGPALSAMLGLWWADLATAFRRHGAAGG